MNEHKRGCICVRCEGERDVLAAMAAFTEDDLRASVAASRGCPPDYPQHRETQISAAVCSAELRRRGLDPDKEPGA